MKWLLLVAILTVVPLCGEEAPLPSVREKVRARIVETLLVQTPAGSADAKVEQESPVLVLEPMVVLESRGVRELEKVLADAKQRQEAERFSVLKGGKIYSSERLDVGIWWAPGGWELLKIKW